MLLTKNKHDFYIREHEYYWTPMEYFVQSRLSYKKLNLSNTHIAQELARFYYHKMVMEKDMVEEKYKHPEKLSEHELQKAQQKEGFYEALMRRTIPGMTPLDKAINLLTLISKKNGGHVNPEAMSEKELTEVFMNIPDDKLMFDAQLNELFEQRGEMEDFSKRVDFLKKIAMVDSFGKSFEIRKTVTERRVATSQMHKQKRMMEYSELVSSQLYQRMLPNFPTKLITKDLVVNTPVVSEESKQKIIMLIDFSGSMHSDHKQEWVKSILADRLAYCMREECEIFFSFFLTHRNLTAGTFQWHHIYNRETALAFWKKFNDRPNGGDTEIGMIIEEIRKEIMENKKLFNLNIDLSKEQPEILVINDGQDSMKTNNLTWKTNGITLFDGANSELGKLCQKTGGKYINVDHTMHKQVTS